MKIGLLSVLFLTRLFTRFTFRILFRLNFLMEVRHMSKELYFDFEFVVNEILSKSEPVLVEQIKGLKDFPDWFLQRQNVFVNSVLTSYFLYLLPRVEKDRVYTELRKTKYYPKLRDVAKQLNLPVVQDRQVYEPEGLFSEQIFGPVEDYHCQCGLAEQIEKLEDGAYPRCPICGVELAPSYLREIRLATIELPPEVRQPVYISTAHYKRFLDKVRSGAVNPETGELNFAQLEFELINYLCKVHNLPFDEIIENDAYKALVLLMYTSNYVVVIPPALRPVTEYGDRDSLNWYYIQILRTIINYTTANAYKGRSVLRLYETFLEFFTMLKKKWTQKEGFSRGKLQGKRIAWSGRAYVIPDSSLPFGHIQVPLFLALDVLEPMLIRKLPQYSSVELRRYKELSKLHPSELTQKELKELENLAKTVNKLLENEKEFVFINRQPTLHVPNILGVYISVYPVGKAIKLSHGWFGIQNGDFDGDSVVKVRVQLRTTDGKLVFDDFIEHLENYCRR